MASNQAFKKIPIELVSGFGRPEIAVSSITYCAIRDQVSRENKSQIRT